jgi:2-iminobutanoate/2-iminopropanoate deaminase
MYTIKALIILLAGLATAADARAIERYKISGAAPALILQGVLVPAGADMLFLSGQVASPIDPAKTSASGLTITDYGDTRTQTINVLSKIKIALESHGFAIKDVIKLTVFLAGDPKLAGKMDFDGMNTGFKTFFGTPENPDTVARSTVQVAALAGPNFLVEIEATVARSGR